MLGRWCRRCHRCGWAPTTVARVKPVISVRATSEPPEQEPSQPDIDQLAAFLSQKAAKMRASMDELDLPLVSSTDVVASVDAAVPAGASLPGFDLPMSTVDVMDAMDDREGFISQEFTIIKLLGKLGVQDAAASPTSSLDGGLPPALDDGNTSVIVYAARYNSGLPYQGPVTVLLREYLPISRKVALNEMMVQQRLWGELPREKWQAATADPNNTRPVVRLLGYLEAPPSDEAFAITTNPADTLWLVYKFEGLRPVSLMLDQIDLPEEPTGLQSMFMSKEVAIATAVKSRHKLLQTIARGVLQALSYCHQRGVAHCGLGPGSAVINSWSDKDVHQLLVKLDNFGLARLYPQPLEEPLAVSGAELAAFTGSSNSSQLISTDDTDAGLQRQADLQAAGLLLAEVFMIGAAAAGAQVLDVPALKRLLFDVFHEDISLFKEYCLQDPDDFGGFVDFMDVSNGAGWELLKLLLAGKKAAGEVVRASRFFAHDMTADSTAGQL